MELSGDEKRIQALFSELAVEDRNRTPRFEGLWSRAQQTRAPQVRSTWAVVMAGAALVVAACSIVALAWYRSIESVSQQALNIPSQTISTPVVPLVHELAVLPATPRSEPRRQRRITRHRQFEPTITTEATLLSKWQSPTQKFMEAPTGVALQALPQLNQSVEDLKLFLSRNTEVKESNQ